MDLITCPILMCPHLLDEWAAEMGCCRLFHYSLCHSIQEQLACLLKHLWTSSLTQVEGRLR